VRRAGQVVAEGAGGVLDGADEQVVQERPVLERRLGERRAAAPAPDEVQDAVDRPEALPERCRPVPGGGLVEQVDRAGVQARHVEPQLGHQRVELLHAAVGQGERRPGRREHPGDARPEPAARAGDGVGAARERLGAHAATGAGGASFWRSEL
jgi:hypothetical protein